MAISLQIIRYNHSTCLDKAMILCQFCAPMPMSPCNSKREPHAI